MVSGDLVYVPDLNGSLLALDAKTGELVSSDNMEAGWGIMPYRGVLLVNTQWSIYGTTLKAFASQQSFRMQVEPTGQIVAPMRGADWPIHFHATYGFTETLQLTVAPVPEGISASVTPSRVLPSEVATVTVAVSPNISTSGWFTLTVIANSAAITQTKSVPLFAARSYISLPLVFH